jgi:hypothetical protein
VSATDDRDEAERAERHRAREERKARSEGFALPMPERIPRGAPPKREILTARERLEREHEERDSTRALKAFAMSLVALVVVLAIVFAIASAFDNGSPPKSAPWGAKGAPTVTPQPISEQ